jgi:hypothetical protein
MVNGTNWERSHGNVLWHVSVPLCVVYWANTHWELHNFDGVGHHRFQRLAIEKAIIDGETQAYEFLDEKTQAYEFPMRLSGLQSSGEWNGSAFVHWRNSDSIVKLETLNCIEEGDEGMNIDTDEDMLGVDKEGNKEGDEVDEEGDVKMMDA